MNKKILIVIDMQNDFITGTLGTEEAKRIVPLVVKRINEFEGDVILTQDTHNQDYLNTLEGKHLPIVHCIIDTDGWKIQKDVRFAAENKTYVRYQKNTFSSIELAKDLLKINENNEIQSIELIGLCTDICVISNALMIKAYIPEVEIFVNESCCAGVTIESHKAALETMRMCQINVINKI
jgi:nicotinamidase/pyrazinamidase